MLRLITLILLPTTVGGCISVADVSDLPQYKPWIGKKDLLLDREYYVYGDPGSRLVTFVEIPNKKLVAKLPPSCEVTIERVVRRSEKSKINSHVEFEEDVPIVSSVTPIGQIQFELRFSDLKAAGHLFERRTTFK